MNICLKCLRLQDKTCPFKTIERANLVRCTALRKRAVPAARALAGRVNADQDAAGKSGGVPGKASKDRKYRYTDEVQAEKQPPLTYKIQIPEEVLAKIKNSRKKKKKDD